MMHGQQNVKNIVKLPPCAHYAGT